MESSSGVRYLDVPKYEYGHMFQSLVKIYKVTEWVWDTNYCVRISMGRPTRGKNSISLISRTRTSSIIYKKYRSMTEWMRQLGQRLLIATKQEWRVGQG